MTGTKVAQFIDALNTAMAIEDSRPKFPIKSPELFPGVVPKSFGKPVVAMDSDFSNAYYEYARMTYGATSSEGFPGYPYLARLANRPEYRAFGVAISRELTREWIKFSSNATDSADAKQRISVLEQEFERMDVRSLIRKASEQDTFYGRGQIAININDDAKEIPLILSPLTVPKGSKLNFVNVEPIWTTPVKYNAIDPTDKAFFKPTEWFMMGERIHSSRLPTIITREVPDILKPAFNFGGISLSQLAEPYVENWIRTRKSVSDLIHIMSLTNLGTDMAQILQGGDEALGGVADLINRIKLFIATRNNQGVMLTDMEKEKIEQFNITLAGLNELQAQAQEGMCAVSGLPSVVLLGVAPSGFGNVAEGEMQSHYNNISAMQEAYYHSPLDIIQKLIQLVKFGNIDPSISVDFNPLYQMTQKEEAEIEKTRQEVASGYIQDGVIEAQEERVRLARDPEGIYTGLDTSIDVAGKQAQQQLELLQAQGDNDDDEPEANEK
jgi:phage-related protein (TIGR01555 family)